MCSNCDLKHNRDWDLRIPAVCWLRGSCCVSLSVCLCLSVCLYVYVSVCLCVWLYVCVSLCRSQQQSQCVDVGCSSHGLPLSEAVVNHPQPCQLQQHPQQQVRWKRLRTQRRKDQHLCVSVNRVFTLVPVIGGPLQMEKDDKGSTMIRMGVSGWMFLLVPAYPGCPGSKAVKRSLLLLLLLPKSKKESGYNWGIYYGTIVGRVPQELISLSH